MMQTVSLPIWFILIVLLLVVALVPTVALVTAWIAHTSRVGKSPLAFKPPKIKAVEGKTESRRSDRPNLET